MKNGMLALIGCLFVGFGFLLGNVSMLRERLAAQSDRIARLEESRVLPAPVQVLPEKEARKVAEATMQKLADEVDNKVVWTATPAPASDVLIYNAKRSLSGRLDLEDFQKQTDRMKKLVDKHYSSKEAEKAARQWAYLLSAMFQPLYETPDTETGWDFRKFQQKLVTTSAREAAELGLLDPAIGAKNNQNLLKVLQRSGQANPETLGQEWAKIATLHHAGFQTAYGHLASEVSWAAREHTCQLLLNSLNYAARTGEIPTDGPPMGPPPR